MACSKVVAKFCIVVRPDWTYAMTRLIAFGAKTDSEKVADRAELNPEGVYWAVTVAPPIATPVARPLVSTVTLVISDEDHVTDDVTSDVEPSVNVAVAVS